MFEKLSSSEGVGLQGLDDLIWNDPNVRFICSPYHAIKSALALLGPIMRRSQGPK